jgi:hypothetical protein
MLRIQRALVISGVLAALGLLAGCGQNFPVGAANPSPAPTSSSFSPTASAASTVTGGPITLRTDALLYQPGDPIVVTLSNGSKQTIYFPDHQTNCTVVLLQRLQVQPLAEQGGPTAINPCPLAIPTRIHSLGPGQRRVVTLVAPKGGWPVGRYLATLNYWLSPSVPATPLSSPAFVVGSGAPQP